MTCPITARERFITERIAPVTNHQRESNQSGNETNAEITKDLTLLGHDVRQPMRKLEAFPNQHPGRRYTVTLVCNEFTCVCPMTGQPDFATITIRYVPDQKIVESKSLKLYLWSYRNEGTFHEHVTNQILEDLVQALDPISCEVIGAFNVRGGIAITVEARHEKAAAATPAAGV
jgi:7-cyano-7-deazaguanine reductase